MRNILFLALCISYLFTSCSEDFKVGADYKEITAVYGILAASDTAHYIKVNKGFFSESLDNLVLAGNADSIYYNNLEVKMDEVNNGNIVNSTLLNKVDLTAEGYPKQSGTFATAPNVAYKYMRNLQSNYEYRLTVTNKTTGKVIKGSTKIVPSDPVGFKITNPLSVASQLDFASANGGQTFKWEMPDNASVAEISMDFKYQELDVTTQVRKNLSKRIVLIPAVSTTELNQKIPFSEKLLSQDFFQLMSSACGSSTDNIQRFIDTPNVYFTAATPDLKQYIDITTTSVGLTNDQVKPNFTKLEGENAIGIFSSRATRSFINLRYNQGTLAFITSDASLASLKFKGISNQ